MVMFWPGAQFVPTVIVTCGCLLEMASLLGSNLALVLHPLQSAGATHWARGGGEGGGGKRGAQATQAVRNRI